MNINKKLHNALLRAGYKIQVDWYIIDDFCIKFNKKTITQKGKKGTVLTYVNPRNLTENELSYLIVDL